jgi:hypothetical protein
MHLLLSPHVFICRLQHDAYVGESISLIRNTVFKLKVDFDWKAFISMNEKWLQKVQRQEYSSKSEGEGPSNFHLVYLTPKRDRKHKMSCKFSNLFPQNTLIQIEYRFLMWLDSCNVFTNSFSLWKFFLKNPELCTLIVKKWSVTGNWFFV